MNKLAKQSKAYLGHEESHAAHEDHHEDHGVAHEHAQQAKWRLGNLVLDRCHSRHDDWVGRGQARGSGVFVLHDAHRRILARYLQFQLGKVEICTVDIKSIDSYKLYDQAQALG